jgi:hypothetical protein
MANKKTKHAPQSLVLEIVRANPSIKAAKLREAIEAQGYQSYVSSTLSAVRRKLGVVAKAPGLNKAVTLVDVEVAADLPSVLGISVKETLETCQNVEHIALKLGGLQRLIEALTALQKFTKLG